MTLSHTHPGPPRRPIEDTPMEAGEDTPTMFSFWAAQHSWLLWCRWPPVQEKTMQCCVPQVASTTGTVLHTPKKYSLNGSQLTNQSVFLGLLQDIGVPRGNPRKKGRINKFHRDRGDFFLQPKSRQLKNDPLQWGCACTATSNHLFRPRGPIKEELLTKFSDSPCS